MIVKRNIVSSKEEAECAVANAKVKNMKTKKWRGSFFWKNITKLPKTRKASKTPNWDPVTIKFCELIGIDEMNTAYFDAVFTRENSNFFIIV